MNFVLFLSVLKEDSQAITERVESALQSATGRPQKVIAETVGKGILITASGLIGRSALGVTAGIGWWTPQKAWPDWENDQVDGAFALLRLQDNGDFEAVTDRLGSEPLWWATHNGSVAVCNRADVLVDVLGIPKQLNPQAIFDYLYFHCVPTPMSIFAGVTRMGAGQRLTVVSGLVQSETWWRPQFKTQAFDFEQEKQKFFRALRESVAERGGDGCGSFLSGGIDSSSITAVLQEQQGGSPAFSMGFSQQAYDEMEFAETAASKFGAKHETLQVTADHVVDNLRRIARFTPEPFGNSSALPTLVCADFAASQGVTTLLAGDGGDELFGGNERYSRQLLFDMYDRAPKFLRAAANALASVAGKLPLWLARKFARYVEQAQIAMPQRMQSYNPLMSIRPETLLTPTFVRNVDTQHPTAVQAAAYGACDAPHIVDRMLALDWQLTLTDNDLRKVSWMTELAGVRAEYPYLDRRMIAIAQELPAKEKVTTKALRVFIKKALRGYLPDKILDKKKHGFGLPVGPWLLEDTRLRQMSKDLLEALVERGYLQQDAVDTLLSKHLREHSPYYGPLVWTLMMLELWCQEHDVQV